MSSVTYFPELYIFAFLVLIIYTIAAAAFEHYRIHFLHESGLAIIMGIIIGVIFYFVNGGEYNLTFDESAFFYFLLPPIIFAAGYNLKRRNFFKNFPYIFIFGILGTIVTFLVILGLTYTVSEIDWIYIQSSPDPQRNKAIVHLTLSDCLYFAATTCATDTVASLTILKPRKHPKLFSVIFGESTLNDVVAIILFQAINVMSQGKEISVDGSVIGTIIGNFFKIGILSILIGLTCGLICSLLLKHAHFLKISVIFEISIIFFFGYLSYVICQNIELSGILSLLICGIVMAHYAFYNISITSKLATGITFQTISHAVEGFLFIYIGLVCVFKDSEWSVGFIFAEFFILVLSRFANIIIMSLIFVAFYKITGSKWDLDIFELLILVLAGTIRGAVAFALILIMTGTNSMLLQVTTYVNLMISTIFMGALMPHLLKLILAARDRCYPERALINENEISELNIQDRTQSLLPYKHNKEKKSNILHSKWRKLDDEYFKPFFIYNYHEVKAEIDYQHRLSINEIYKVEFNANAMDYRNPLPYSIKELDISEVISKKKGNRKNRTYGNREDLDASIEQVNIRNSDGEVNYNYKFGKNLESQEIVLNQESLATPISKDQSQEEILRKQFYREKITNERINKNKKKAKKSGTSNKKHGDSINKSENYGDNDDSPSDSPEEKKH